jgi:hypothetical protein
MHRVFLGLSLFIVVTLTGISGVFAAPQILALLETTEPTPLACSGGVCRAEFSTMCLQKDRDIPPPGTAYAPAKPESVVLVLYRADGSATRVEGHPDVRFAVPNSYQSAMASLSEADLNRLGAVRAAIEIAPLASLVPEPKPGDTSPITADEIATVTGTSRMVADHVVKHAQETISAVRAANRFANVLLLNPVGTREERRALWQDIVAATREDAAKSGLHLMESIIDTCQFYDEQNGYRGFRGCLRYRRDMMLDSVNDTYWRRKDLGS